MFCAASDQAASVSCFRSKYQRAMPRRGIGIIKGLFAWTGKYQRTRDRINPRTSLFDRREFILRVGSDRPIVLGSGRHGASLWGVGWETGQRGSVGSRNGTGSRWGDEAACRKGLGIACNLSPRRLFQYVANGYMMGMNGARAPSTLSTLRHSNYTFQ